MDRHVRFARRALCAAVTAAALALLALPTPAHAQAVRGTLLGNIADTSGSAVPGATITVTDQGTNISSTTVTNQDRLFTFPNLKDAIYRVEAELTGFKKVVRENVRVDVNTTIRVDLTLEAGAITEVLTVSADPPPLQSDRADTGRIIQGEQIAAMPLGFGRNFQGMVATVPGASKPVPAALRVLQLAGFAVVERQRPVAPRQQRADRGRRQQPPHRSADRADSVGRSARDRQRHDQQLRRRVRPRRRRRHQRHAQVGHQPVQGQRLLLRQHRSDRRHQPVRRPYAAQRAPEGHSPPTTRAASRSAGRSSATGCSSSATTSAPATTSAGSTATPSRRWRCATATSAPRACRSSIR